VKIKNNQIVLDAVDWGILQALQEDAKQTYTEIGRRLGVAHSTVYDHIKKMERSHIIKQYRTVVDLQKLGIKNITAFMTVFTDPREAEKLALKLATFKEVLEVSTCFSEELAIIAKVVVHDQEELQSFIAQTVAPLHGVLRIRTSIVTKKYKEEELAIQNK
jgi:Lrp/AsnC family leucine-responsive transcriptional regulator